MIEIYLYDKDNLFRVFPIDFDIPVPPISCPGFTKPLGLWGINMSKEINMFYTYSFPKLLEGSKITKVSNLDPIMVYFAGDNKI